MGLARRRAAIDATLAVVAVGLDVALFSRLTEDAGRASWVTWPVSPLLVVAAGSLAVPVLLVRHRFPVAVCLTICLHAAVLTLLMGSRPLVSVAVALYTAAGRSRNFAALACLSSALGAHAVTVAYEVTVLDPDEQALDGLLVATVLVLLDLAVWAAGRLASRARARARMLEESREALAAAAVATERARLARELHDIVAHSVTVMVLQAAGARRVLAAEPDRADTAMRAVEEVGRQTAVELRRLLGLLNPGEGPPAPDDARGRERLDAIDGVVERARAAGISVKIDVQGTPLRLHHSVDLAAYRVVQEGLTNVIRHAGTGSVARILVQWGVSGLGIEVTDGGGGQRHEVIRGLSGGTGLIGLHERVRVVGGELHAGAVDGRGFTLRADLPVDGG